MSDSNQDQNQSRFVMELDLPPVANPDPPALPTSSPVSKVPQGPQTGYGTGYSQISHPDEVHLVDYLRVLHKRRWTALSAFIVVVGSVTLYTFTVTPIYSARVQILIENENPNVVKFEEVYEQNKTTNDYYQTQYRILQSRLLARRTIESERLWEHPLL